MTDTTGNLLTAALACRDAGLCVLPAIAAEKRPALRSWKEYRHHLPTEEQVRTWFAGAEALCIVAGAVSGNLEMVDFDGGGLLYGPWAELVLGEAPGLLERLVIERSPSGGCHVVYRCEAPVPGNQKLAQRLIDSKPATLIETRGEGGLFLCDPTPGYALQQGSFTDLPVLSAPERGILVKAARALNEVAPQPEPVQASSETGGRPGDDFNERGDVSTVLRKHGWTLVKPGENEYWRRPGKDRGWSATLKDRVFFCFTSGAPPFERDTAYSPFRVYALLEHGGDFARAASALRAEGYGQDECAADTGVDLSGLLGATSPAEPPEPLPPDPGPIPDDLLRVPGFVGEVMDYCLTTAPYPNPVMAFCGALALQSFLAGRKVRDSGDNRTNLYLLGLAHSAAGKDHPRKVNTRVIHEVGLAACLGDRFASGEGIQDALFMEPAMLFQTDEIDGMLQSINKAKDARHENIMGTLLTMYSASNSVFPMRRKAGKDHPGSIIQPSLTLFGTAIPNHYYEALSERMLTNGFFARMIVLESGPRGKGQEPGILDLPPRVLATAKWWADFRPGRGNLEHWHPVPVIVEHTQDALDVLVETREEAEAEYDRAEKRSDPVGTTVWGRVGENVRKLALVHAVSENHEAPRIGLDGARWAARFVMHQTRRMLFMASQHVADNPFHAECLKLLQKLRDAPGREIPHSMLLKRMKIEAKRFMELVDTLVQRGDIEVVTVPRAGAYKRSYRLRG